MLINEISAAELHAILPPSRQPFRLGAKTMALLAQTPDSAPTPPPFPAVVVRGFIAEGDRAFLSTFPPTIPQGNFREEKFSDGVPVSVYRTPFANPATPTILLIHGGGFFCEFVSGHQSLLANIAVRAPCHSVIPHYSLSRANVYNLHN